MPNVNLLHHSLAHSPLQWQGYADIF